MALGYNFLYRKSGHFHIWSLDQKKALCGMWKGIPDKHKPSWKLSTGMPNGTMCPICEERLSSIVDKQGPKMAPVRPEEQAALKRWNGSKNAPSIWEKIDRDVVYEAALKNRDVISDASTLSNQWGIGKPRGPN